MKKNLLVLFVILTTLPVNAQTPLFYGGSANLTGGANTFAGYQVNNKIGIIANYYGSDVISVDLLLNGFIVSEGFKLSNKSQQFVTLLYTPKLRDFGSKGKIFGKTGLNFAGQLPKISSKHISIVFGIGFRWN